MNSVEVKVLSPRTHPNGHRIHRYAIGVPLTGRLTTEPQVESALVAVQNFRPSVLPRAGFPGYWRLTRFIQRKGEAAVPVYFLSSHHSFSAPAFREDGVVLLRRLLAALEAGGIPQGLETSDAQSQHIDPYDLAELTDAWLHGNADAWFTVVGYVVGRRM